VNGGGVSPEKLRKREEGFDLSGLTSPRREYNSLFDEHCSYFLSSPTIRKTLYRNGFIDKEGRVIDVDRARQKLHIVENEFRQIEREHEMHMKDEAARRRAEEMRIERERELREKKMRVRLMKAGIHVSRGVNLDALESRMEAATHRGTGSSHATHTRSKSTPRSGVSRF
jgi:hypothetical protein